MPHRIELSDGTTIVNLAGSTITSPYVLQSGGWSPGVPVQRRNPLGGRGLYDSVQETLTVNLYSTTQAAVLSAYRALVQLLDQAETFERRGTGNPVTLTVQLDGGTAMTARVLGAQQPPRVPVEFLDDLVVYAMRGVEVNLVRQGVYLGASQSASSPLAVNPQLMTATLGSASTVASPTDIQLGGFDNATIGPAFLVLSEGSTQNLLVEAESLISSTGGTGYAVFGDGGSQASGGSILRYTPTGTALAYSKWGATGLQPRQLVQVIAMVRSNSATTSWQIRARFGSTLSASTVYSETPPVVVDGADGTTPRPISLGLVQLRSYRYGIDVSLGIQASAASGTLDIDYLVLVPVAGSTTIAIPSQNAGTNFFTLSILPRALTHRAPLAAVASDSDTAIFDLTYAGDLYWSTSSTSIAARYIGGSGTFWRMQDSTADAQLQLTINRPLAYLVPE